MLLPVFKIDLFTARYRIVTAFPLFLLKLQQGPQDGSDTAQLDRGSRVRADQDAQLPALGIEPSTCQFFQIQHLSAIRGVNQWRLLLHTHQPV